VDQLPIAMIDFDTAGPGPRAWDVAYALFRFVPLVHTDLPDTPGLHDLLGAAARVKLFCDSYGIRASPDLLNLVERRLHALCLYLITRALRGDLAYQRMLTDGHLEIYQRAILALQQAQPALEHCLST
jgi:Ser/Thr protein kinase RdoA (MazF antagonist)